MDYQCLPWDSFSVMHLTDSGTELFPWRCWSVLPCIAIESWAAFHVNLNILVALLCQMLAGMLFNWYYYTPRYRPLACCILLCGMQLAGAADRFSSDTASTMCLMLVLVFVVVQLCMFPDWLDAVDPVLFLKRLAVLLSPAPQHLTLCAAILAYLSAANPINLVVHDWSPKRKFYIFVGSYMWNKTLKEYFASHVTTSETEIKYFSRWKRSEIISIMF